MPNVKAIAIFMLVLGLVLLLWEHRYRIVAWWGENRPIMCVCCGSIVRHKNTRSMDHRVAGQLRVCPKCYHMAHTWDHREDVQ
jgi:hypothetical protein